MVSRKSESFNFDTHQLTLKAELKTRPAEWLEVSVGVGPTLNLTDGNIKIVEGADRNDGLFSQSNWISSGVYKRRQMQSNISELNVGGAIYGNVSINVYKSVWLFAGIRYDHVFGDINKSLASETFKAKLASIEGTGGVRIQW